MWSTADPDFGAECCKGCRENAKEWLALYEPDATPGCWRTPDKKGPCVNPPPVLSQRAEDVWNVFGESFSTVVGMGIGMAPNRTVAAMVASTCGISLTGEFWMLFGDLERAWCSHANEKKPTDE
jgi:hypothetical protein